jgi:hypothetical protein
VTELATTFTFRCARFKPTPGELDENNHDDYLDSGFFSKEVADFIASGLSRYGYKVIDNFVDDWGRWVTVDNPDGCFLSVGIGNYDSEQERDLTTQTHMVFVKPYKSPIRKWFRKIDTEERVMQLVAALGTILDADPEITEVKLGKKGDF